MRLFIGVRPPDAVLDGVAVLMEQLQAGFPERAARPRWTTRDQWHVTLRFLGELDDPRPIINALAAADLAATEATLGPDVGLLGRGVVCLPVTGLEDLAGGVTAATAALGHPPDDRPFHGHLTLARLKGHARGFDHPELAPTSWPVDEVSLVQSRLGRGGARYEDLYVRPLVRSGA